MEKVGILTCIEANQVCTGAGCMNAFFKKTDFFSGYKQDVVLGAFMTCNGCKETQPLEPEEDPGMLEKLERLTQEHVMVIHVGVCRMTKEKKECERISKICEMIESRGIKVIRGTHKE